MLVSARVNLIYAATEFFWNKSCYPTIFNDNTP